VKAASSARLWPKAIASYCLGTEKPNPWTAAAIGARVQVMPVSGAADGQKRTSCTALRTFESHERIDRHFAFRAGCTLDEPESSLSARRDSSEEFHAEKERERKNRHEQEQQTGSAFSAFRNIRSPVFSVKL